MKKSPSIGILLIDGLFVLRWKRYKRYIKVGKDVLLDNLSGSIIPTNSSGIKNNFCANWSEVEIVSYRLWLRAKLARSYFSPIWREVRFLLFDLFPIWEQVRSWELLISLVPKLGTSSNMGKEHFGLWTNWTQVA